MQRTDVRLTEDQIAVLDKLGDLLSSTRSELVRQAVASITGFYKILEAEGLDREQREGVMRIFLASRLSELTLKPDLHVIFDIVRSSGTKKFLNYLQREEKKEEVRQDA